MTRQEKIAELNRSILRIQHDYTQVIGGLKAWDSGRETVLKPSAQKKLDRLIAELDKLQDEIIEEMYSKVD